MKQMLIKNYALIKSGENWAKISKCTTFTDTMSEIVEFKTEKLMDEYIKTNKIEVSEET